ncbi:uncharacterized protein [Brachionichthys hirsutus]|uniref:uncharacterized protein n=1 Tax=Brachionichthys hirsutus TaxID=412623 RepID=UPI0036054086
MSIPVIDFSSYSLRKEDVSEEEMLGLSQQLKAAFTEVGFVFLENTGITQEEADRVLDLSHEFFLQPDELKQPFSSKKCVINPNHGWLSVAAEKLNPCRPGDIKESFNLSSLHPDIKWPTDGLTDFKEIHTSFFHRCKELSLRVLRLMAHSLGLDPEVFLSAHRLVGTDGNSSLLRTLYYPPVNYEEVKEGQMRCGEHTDFGSITLVFQKNKGLQVLGLSGEYIDVPLIPGAILINIADLMQRWTSDRFISVEHRSLLPDGGDSETRQSAAFFLYPDNETQITCLDGSDKYSPVNAGFYIKECFKAVAVEN